MLHFNSVDPSVQIAAQWTQYNSIFITCMNGNVSSGKKQGPKQLLGTEACVLGGEDVCHWIGICFGSLVFLQQRSE